MTPTQPQPKFTKGQKVEFEVTFSASGVVTQNPRWNKHDQTYHYELSEIVAEEYPTNLILSVEGFSKPDHDIASVFLEEDLEDPEASVPEDLPSCEFDPN